MAGEDNKKLKTHIINVLKLAWLLFVGYAAYYYISLNWNEIVVGWKDLEYWSVFLSFLFLLIAKFIICELARCSVKARGHHISFRQSFIFYNSTQLAKYIPGAIWHFVGRSLIYRNLGMSLEAAGKSLLAESFWLVLGAALVFLGFCLLGALLGESDPWLAAYGLYSPLLFNKPPIYITLLLSVLLLIGLFVLKNNFFRSIFRVLKPSSFAFMLLILVHIVLGVSFYVLCNSVEEIPISFVMSIHAIATLLGFLAFFAPAGLGVKDFTVVALLAFTMDQPLAILVVTIHRIIYVVVDILLGGTSFMMVSSRVQEARS